MDRNEKHDAVEALKGVFDSSGSVILTHYSGLNVAEMTKLRNGLREAGGSIKVVKNRLAKIALKGKPGEGASDLFQGPVAIAYGPDAVSAAKIAVQFAKENDKLKLVGGILDQSNVLDEAGVRALATLPSLDELRAKIVGLIVAPATKLAKITQAPAAQIARVLSAYAEKEAA